MATFEAPQPPPFSDRGAEVAVREAPSQEPAATSPTADQSAISVLADLPTGAPSVGAVRPLPDPTIRPGQPWRTHGLVADAVVVDTWAVAGASLAGTSHLVSGTPRQDAYDLALLGDGSLVVVVADGLGSRPASQLGARLLCEGVVHAAVGGPDGSGRPADLLAAGSQWAETVATGTYGLQTTDIACVAVVARFTAEGCELARVGDASAFVMNADGVTELFAAPAGAVNAVDMSLPDPAAQPEPSSTPHPVVALVTDGLAMDLRMSAAVREWLCTRWKDPLGPHAMSDSLRYRRQGSHDDRTAVVVWRR